MLKNQIFIIASVFLSILFYSSLPVSSQEKMLTIKEAVIGQWQSLYPETLKKYAWIPESHEISYVTEENKLVKRTINSEKTTDLLSLDSVNAYLENMKADKFSYFPSYQWIDANNIVLHQNHIFVFFHTESGNMKKFVLPEKSENHDLHAESKAIAYTLDNNLFVADYDGNTTEITNISDKNIVSGQSVSRREFGIEKGTFWSPSGQYLAFYQKDESKVSDYPIVDITTPIAATEPVKYPMAGMASEHVCIGVYDFRTGETICIEKDTISEKYLTTVTWGPANEYLYVAVLNRAQNHMKLNKYDIKTGTLVKTLFEEKDDKYVEPEHILLFHPENPGQFIWQTDQRDGYNHLFLFDDEGNYIRQLTQGNWEVTEVLGFDKKARNLFYVSTEESPVERHVYKLDLKKGKREKLTRKQGWHQPTLSSDGTYFTDNFSNTETPRILQVISHKGKRENTLVEAKNPLEGYKQVDIEISTLKAADNKTELFYRILKPSDLDPNKKYPVLVYVYGGPHVQLVENSWLAGARMWQYYMAQQGFIVFSIDNRGSAHRGLEFENVTFRQLGQVEMKDQLKGVEFLKSLDYVDTTRMAVHGWSYGGFMTISLMINFPGLFKTGVAGGPVTDWKYYEVMYGERYMDTPEENPEGYKKTSLLNKSEKLQGDLLIIHGAIDPTVVWQHSLAFIRKCIENNVQVDYFVYPRAEHNVRGIDRVHLMDKICGYIMDNL